MILMQKVEDGVQIETQVSSPPEDVPPVCKTGERGSDLLEHDRVDLYFVDEDAQYCVLSIGVGGQYFLQGFDGQHERLTDFPDFKVEVKHEKMEDGRNVNILTLPCEMFPTKPRAFNAFLIAGGQKLAYHPLQAGVDELHQLGLFPFIRFEK